MAAEADAIFTGGDVVTVDAAMSEAEALAVGEGRILAVGSREEIEALAGAATERVDLDGRTLMPGFVEPHGHPLFSALIHGAPVVDISAMTVPTYDAVIEKIKRRVAKAEAGEFLFFVGLDPQLHQGMRQPTRAELDALAPHNPLAVQTSNIHAVFANSLALEASGITADTPSPMGGVIGRDAQGELTGKLEEAAIFRLCQTFYDIGGEARTRAELRQWMWKFAHAGITTGTELLFQPYYLPYYREIMAEADPPLRIRAYHAAARDGATVVPPGAGDDHFAVIGVKIIADGSPFVGNIWVSRPYLNTEVTLKGMSLPPDNTGHASYAADELQDLIYAYAGQGWQMAVHTQGDRTIDMVLDCYERALEKHPRRDHRFRLEHCALARPDQIARAQRLGVVCSFFLTHLYYWGEALRDQMFGAEVADGYMPVGAALDQGMRISFHSDPPMTDPAPLLCMQLGVTRRSRDGAVIGADQRVDVDAAIRAVTIDAAYHLFMEDRIGSLEAGKYADLVILGENPRRADPEHLSQIRIDGTYLAGRPVWPAR
jgi:predicted amidohydrolase YtcJ